jgi:hypothetical protein
LPRAIAGHAAAWHDGVCWVAGGSWWEGDRKRIGTEIWRRRDGGAAWENAGAIAGGFAHGGFAADARGLWLAGGLDERGVSAAVRRIEFATGAVTVITRLPEPRVYGGAAVFEGALWVLGGVAAEGDLSRTSGEGWRIDARTGAVSALPPGPALINPLVLALDGALHVLPGGAWSAERRRLEAPAKIYVYAPATGRWSERPLSRALPRGLSGAALDARHALLTGGVELRGDTATIAAGAWRYEAATGVLDPSAALPEPRLAAALVREARGVLVLGGEDRPRGRVATVWRFPTTEAP